MKSLIKAVKQAWHKYLVSRSKQNQRTWVWCTCGNGWRDENLQTGTNSAINYDRMLSPVVLEAIQNDAQIKALNQRMNDLYKYSTPKYVMQTNGEINAVNSKEFDEAVAKIVEQIELRQQQIISAYNWR